MRDFQDLNNHCNTIDRSETVTGIFDARLKETKICSPDKLILGHANTNSIRNNFHSLVYLLDKNIEIFLNSWSKTGDSFHAAQIKIEDITTPYRYDRSNKGSDLLFCISEDILSRLLHWKKQCNAETLSVEVDLRKRNWFSNCSYNPHKLHHLWT